MEAKAPAKIIELVEKFERDQDIYRSSQYNETELRTEFINPLFEALGCDVYHKQECRADKREVKEEDAVDVEGKIKNPDYKNGGSMSERAKAIDESELRVIGIEALNKALGPAEALRFLALFHREPTDYVDVSKKLYEN